MSWYRTGTAAFTNGNATVTGTGTAWIANASIGEGLIAPDGRIYEITAVASDTSLTISPAYLGSTASGQAYAVAPIRGRIAQLLSETSSLLASFATVRDGIGSGLFPNGTVSAPALRAAADQDTGLFFPAANTLAMATGGAERLRVAASGNVGIGTSSPGAKLHLSETSSSNYVRVDNTNGAFFAGVKSTGEGYVSTETSDPLTFATVGTERMRIDSVGDVSIGNPVSGGWRLRIDKPNSEHMNLLNTAGTGVRLFLADQAWAAEIEQNAGSLLFKTGGTTERMRIDSSGNVGIGTTPASTFHVASSSGSSPINTAGNNAIRIRSTAAAGVGVGPTILFEGQTGNTTANYGFAAIQGFKASASASDYSGSLAFFTQSSGGSTALTERMRIDSSGNVGIGATSVTALFGRTLQIGSGGTNATLSLVGASGNGFIATNGAKLDVIGRAGMALALGAGDLERMRIDSNGNVGIGTSSPSLLLQVASRGGMGSDGKFYWGQALTGSNRGFLSWNTDIASVNAAANLTFGTNGGTERMRIDASGNVGIGTSSSTNKLTVAGAIDFSASAFSGSGTGIWMPLTNELGFVTAGSTRLRIDSAGIVRPGADNTQSLGEASFRWSTVFAGTGTINTSDEREKVWRGAMTDAEMRAAKRLLAELGMFQFTDSVTEKGEDARLHFGVRAQKAFAILEDEGLEWWRYAWCCHDKWDEITEPVMEEVTVEKTRTVEKPVTVEKTRTVEVPEEREVEKTETVMEPVFDEETGEQVMDENGEPVMTEIEQTFTVTETVTVEIEETYEETVFEDVEETYEETEQRDTGEVRVVREAGDRYGIRADQLAYWLIAAQAEIQNDLDARLAKLEAAQ